MPFLPSLIHTVSSLLSFFLSPAPIFTADRACRPDCVFVRQHLKNLGEDYRSIILGLQYGNIPAVNPLRALYNFTDRPWVVSYCDVLCTFFSLLLPLFISYIFLSCSSSSPVLTVNHDPAKTRQGELSLNRANILSQLQRNGESQTITTHLFSPYITIWIPLYVLLLSCMTAHHRHQVLKEKTCATLSIEHRTQDTNVMRKRCIDFTLFSPTLLFLFPFCVEFSTDERISFSRFFVPHIPFNVFGKRNSEYLFGPSFLSSNSVNTVLKHEIWMIGVGHRVYFPKREHPTLPVTYPFHRELMLSQFPLNNMNRLISYAFPYRSLFADAMRILHPKQAVICFRNRLLLHSNYRPTYILCLHPLPPGTHLFISWHNVFPLLPVASLLDLSVPDSVLNAPLVISVGRRHRDKSTKIQKSIERESLVECDCLWHTTTVRLETTGGFLDPRSSSCFVPLLRSV